MASVLVLAALFLIAKRSLLIKVSETEVLYPSFPPHHIAWNELSNIVLRDGLLTIDLKNNKLIQQLIEETNTVNQDEFNEFCRRRLAAASSPKVPGTA